MRVPKKKYKSAISTLPFILIFLAVIFTIMLAYPAAGLSAEENSEVYEEDLMNMLKINPDFEEISFYVEGEALIYFPLIDPALKFAGQGMRNGEGIAPEIDLEEASFEILYFTLGDELALNIAENLTNSILKITEPEEEIWVDYQTLFKNGSLFFVHEALMAGLSSPETAFEKLQNNELADGAAGNSFDGDGAYGGKLNFNEEREVITNIEVYSEDWWADLEIIWEQIGDEFKMPAVIRGEGHYLREFDVKIHLSSYEIVS